MLFFSLFIGNSFSCSIILKFSSFFYIEGCNVFLTGETWMNKNKYMKKSFYNYGVLNI